LYFGGPMVPMDETERGRIAYRILKAELRRREIKFNSEAYRQLGNLAKESGVGLPVLIEFAKYIFGELVEEALTPPSKGGGH